MTGEQRYTWSEWLAKELAAARRENATLREAISVYVAEVARAAECLGKQMFTDEGYDPTVVSALGYMGDLDPGHDTESDIARATVVIRAALAASPAAEEPSRCPRCEGYEARHHTFAGECSAAEEPQP